MRYEAWLEEGEPILWQYEIPGGESRGSWIFTKIMREYGVEKPWLTVLHGHPGHSGEWAKLAPLLMKYYHLFFVDFLGYGASDKPSEHKYSLIEQADIIEFAWDYHGIHHTNIISQGIGGSVATELLARRSPRGEIENGANITRACFLNSAIMPDMVTLHPLEKDLLRPMRGAFTAWKLGESKIRQTIDDVSIKQCDDDSWDVIWQGIEKENGHKLAHRQIAYIADRKKYKDRWQKSLEEYKLPLYFIWGVADPSCGTDMINKIGKLCPKAEILPLRGVGHFPHIEAPEKIAEEMNALEIDKLEREKKALRKDMREKAKANKKTDAEKKKSVAKGKSKGKTKPKTKAKIAKKGKVKTKVKNKAGADKK